MKGVVETSDQRLEDHCNTDGTLTEKYCTTSGTAGAEKNVCPNGCMEGACIKGECAEEGELTSGTVAPEYYYGCCEGLETFDPFPLGYDVEAMVC